MNFRFDSLIDCSQALKKKGKRLQTTLIQRLGHVYTHEQSMQVRVRGEVPMLEIVASEKLPSQVYDGESFLSSISIRNSGQVALKDLQGVISHTSIFRFCSDTQPTAESRSFFLARAAWLMSCIKHVSTDLDDLPIWQPTCKASILYEKASDTCMDSIVIETSNHLITESPALLAPELMNGETVQASIVCRGEEVGTHATCWLFVFRHAVSHNLLS